MSMIKAWAAFAAKRQSQPFECGPGPLATNEAWGQRSLSGSPAGTRSVIDAMLELAARHAIEPTTAHFPLNRVNDAIAHPRAGNARYRIVLDAGG